MLTIARLASSRAKSAQMSTGSNVGVCVGVSAIRVCRVRSAVAGQSIVEYVLLFGIVTAALLGMQVFAKRGLQAGVKMAADQMSPVPNDPKGEQAQLLGMNYEAGEKQDEPLPGTHVGQFLTKASAVDMTTNRSGTAQATAGGGVVTATNETTTRTGVLEGGGVSSDTSVVVDVHE